MNTHTHTPNIPGTHIHIPPKYTRGTHTFTHTLQIYQGHTPQIHQGHTHTPHIYQGPTQGDSQPATHTQTHTHTHTDTHTHVRAPFPLVPASGRGWGVGPPTPVTHEAAAARGPLGGSLTLSLERKHVTAWSGGPVVPSQAKPWEGLLPHSRDVLISFCRQRKWRRGT